MDGKLPIYKFESVCKWLENLDNLKDYFGKCKCEDARKFINGINGNKGLQKFLTIMWEWLHAHPRILNPDITLNPDYKATQPTCNKSFELYDYVNPYKAAIYRSSCIADGVSRLRGSMLSSTAGFNAPTTLANISINTATGSGIGMPFNRAGPLGYNSLFPTPSVSVGRSIYGGQEGGHHGIEEELKKINDLYGYQMFKNIFDEYKTIHNTLSKESGKTFRLSQNSWDNIEKELNQFGDLEKDLRKKLAETVMQKKLYTMTHGVVDTRNLPAEQIPAVMEKYSDLLHTASAFNKKGIKMIDIVVTIDGATREKFTVKN